MIYKDINFYKLAIKFKFLIFKYFLDYEYYKDLKELKWKKHVNNIFFGYLQTYFIICFVHSI